MNCRTIKINRWYITDEGYRVYVTSNSRSEGPKGYYIANGVGYGKVKITHPELELDETALLEANHALSRTNNMYCKEIARVYFEGVSKIKRKEKREVTQNLFPENPSWQLKLLAGLVVLAVATFLASLRFL